MTVVRPSCLAAGILLFFAAGPSPAQFSINIVPDGTFSGFSDPAGASAALQRAATAWSSRITSPTPLTINISAGRSAIGPAGNLAVASTAVFDVSFNTVRNAMAGRSGLPDLGILASLPTAAQFNATLPAGVSLSGNISVTKANARSLGLSGIPISGDDGGITFNSNTTTFDFDRSNGVSGNDFESVAIHEIGHILGFSSAVDDVTGGATSISPTTWDLFRFNNASGIPANATQFTGNPREFRPGQEAVQHDVVTGFRVSTGAGMGGDGNQASHWRADELPGGVQIGVMDPTLLQGTFLNPSEADFRTMALIGFNVTPVPEPATILGVAALALVVRRFRRRTTEGPALAA